jgi:hypothetical protein
MAITYSGGTITVSGAKDTGTSTGGSSTTIVDTSKSWTVDAYVGRIVWNRTDNYMGFILSNTSNTLTVENWHKCNLTSKKVTFGAAASGKAYSICYNFADLVADQPSYCSWENASTADICRINAKLNFSSNGALADVGKSLHHTGDDQWIECTNQGCLFQMGRINKSGYGVDGGTYIMTQNTTGYPEPDMFSLWCMYGGKYEVSKSMADTSNSNLRYNLGDWANLDGFWFLDSECVRAQICLNYTYFMLRNKFFKFNNNLYGPTNVYSGNVLQEGMIAPRGDDANIQWAGGDIFDATVGGVVAVGVATNPIFVYRPERADQAAYLWNFKAPEYAVENYIQWYVSGSPNEANVSMYFGHTIAIQVNDASGSPLEGVVLGLYDTDGNPAWVTGKGNAGAYYAPVTSAAITTNASGTYEGPYGTDEGGFVVKYKLTRIGTGASSTSTVKDYSSWTLIVGKYGYVSQQYSRSYNERSSEGLSLLANPYVVANSATAAGYSSKFSINWSTRVITVTGDATPQQMYDYTQYSKYQIANIGYDELMTPVSPGLFDMGDTRIVIASGGTLTVNETAGTLQFGDRPIGTVGIEIKSGGTLNTGTSSTNGTVIDFKQDLTNDLQSYQAGYSSIECESGGTWNWAGGVIQSHHFAYHGGNGTISGNAEFYNEGTQTTSTGSYPGFQLDSATLNITSGIIRNAALNPFQPPTNPPSGLSFFSCNPAVVGAKTANVYNVYKGITFGDTNVKDYIFWDNRWAKFINIASAFTSVGNLPNDSRNKGLGEVWQQITFTSENGGGAKFYAKHTDHGSRLAPNLINNNPDYRPLLEYTLTESAGVASSTGDGIRLGIHWRTVGGAFDTNNNFQSDCLYNDQTYVIRWLKVQYGYQPATLDVEMLDIDPVQSSIAQLLDLGITESNRATVAGYSSKFNYSFGAGGLTITVIDDATLNEMYDYIKYLENQNPDNIAENGYISFISTSNKLSYIYNNLTIVVNGATLTAGAGQVLPTTPTVNSGAFLSDSINLFFDGADLVKASRVYFQVKDSISASNIEGAVIGFGDATAETRLLYNSSFVIDTLVTDSDGKADGYFAYQVGATSYGDMKQITGEYNHIFSTVPRTLTGASIGSSTSPEVIRLAPDNEVTLSKVNASLISGITVDVPTDTIDLSDETLANAYDNLKYQITADADIDTGIPGCMYYCLYGLPLSKSGTTYTGRSITTIYQNVNGTGGTLTNGIVELVTAGTYNDFTFGNIQLNFEGPGVFDLRASSFQGDVTVDTITDETVTVQLPTTVSVTNNDPTNITVEQNEVFQITNPNIVDNTQYFIYNATQDTYLVSGGMTSGGAGLSENRTFGNGEEIEPGDTIIIALNKYEKKGLSISRTASSGGIAFTDTQVDCPICTAYGIDQATALSYGSIFTPDFPNIQIDFQQAGTFNWGVDQFFAWAKAMGSTNADFQKNYNGMFLSTSTYGQLIINTDVVDLFLDNPVAGSIAIQTNSNSNITGRPALIRDDEVSIEFPRTDGGKIILNPSINVVVATVTTSGDVVVTGDLTDIESAITAAKNSIKGDDDRDLTEVYDNAGGGGGATAEEVRIEMDANSTQLAAIKSKTDNLPTDPADQSQVEAKIDAQTIDLKGSSDKDLTQVFDNSPTIDLTDVTDAIDAQTAELKGASDKDLTQVFDNTPSVDLGTMPADVTIKSKTDNLPSDPAGVSDLPADKGTEIDAIKAKTDNLPASPASSDDVPTAEENADAVWNKTLP